MVDTHVGSGRRAVSDAETCVLNPINGIGSINYRIRPFASSRPIS